jgi:DNA-binding FadR family transcriptional regulator
VTNLDHPITLTGRRYFGATVGAAALLLLAAHPAVVAPGGVGQAVAGGSPEQARRAMDDILNESMDAMDQLFPAS